MSINIDELLALPEHERKEIARQLWNSLTPTGSLSDKEIEAIMILEKRWEKMKGEIAQINSATTVNFKD